MKKPKVNLSGDAVKSFFTYHVEKLVLVVVLVLVGLFVMRGYQLEGYTTYTPDRMKTDTEAARATMTRDDVWKDIEADDIRDKSKIEETIRKGLGDNNDGKLPPIPTDASFRPVQPQNAPLFAPNSKRGDPEIYAATEVEVHAGYGPLAMPNTAAPNPNDPLSGLDPLMRAAQQYQLALQQKAIDEANSGRPKRPGAALLGGGEFAEPARLGVGGTPESQIVLTQEQQEAIRGFQAGANVMPRGLNYVAVTALAPYKKQANEYEAVLKDAAGYDLGRDTPRYVWVVVERAEVSDDGQQSPWKAISSTGQAKQMEQYYAGTSPDLVDPRYFDPALTMAVPPIMLRNLTPLAKHSKTPLIELIDESAADTTNQTPDPTRFTEQAPTTIRPGDIAAPGSRGGIGEGGRTNPYANNGFGEGSREGAMESGIVEQEPVDYRLVRFFDFSVQTGKKYRYRVQLWVTDPNRPQDPSLTPPPSLLQEEVIARNAALDQQQMKNPQSPRVFYRTTQWSDPSPVVSVPKQWEVLAGEVPEVKTARVRLPNNTESTFEMPGEEPMARLMTVVWNPKFATEVPGELAVHRGSVLNFTTEVNVLHPATTAVVTLPNYSFDLGGMVLDLRGGDTMPGGDRKNPLMAPAEMLLIDGEGNMLVRSELDDKREFRLHHYEKPALPVVDPREQPEEGREGGGLFGDEGGDGGGRGRQRRG